MLGDFVTTEDGTGIVHIAPSFGADDFRVAKQNGVGSLTLVDKQGRFIAEVTDFAGEYVKEQYYTEEEKEAERKKQGGEKYLSVDDRIVVELKKARPSNRNATSTTTRIAGVPISPYCIIRSTPGSSGPPP